MKTNMDIWAGAGPLLWSRTYHVRALRQDILLVGRRGHPRRHHHRAPRVPPIHGAMIRESLVAGGLRLGWILASAAMVLLTPWAEAMFVAGLSVLLVAVHVWIPRRT